MSLTLTRPGTQCIVQSRTFSFETECNSEAINTRGARDIWGKVALDACMICLHVSSFRVHVCQSLSPSTKKQPTCALWQLVCLADRRQKMNDKAKKKEVEEIAATVLRSWWAVVPWLIQLSRCLFASQMGLLVVGADSAKLVVVGLHQGFLLFLVVTGLFAGAVVTLGLITRLTFCGLLWLHVPVD